jgi:hypothetical protein
MTYLWLIWSRVVLRHGVLWYRVLLSIRDVAHFGYRLIAHLRMSFAITVTMLFEMTGANRHFRVNTPTIGEKRLYPLSERGIHSHSVLFQMWRLNSLSTLSIHYTYNTMVPKASVQEASPSPPPLPPGPIPTASSSNAGPSESQPADVPIASIGEDEDEDDEDEEDEEDDKDEDGEGQKAGAGASEEDGSNDEEWDPAEERLPGQSNSKDKGKGKATEQDGSQPWQAVWAAEQNGKLEVSDYSLKLIISLVFLERGNRASDMDEPPRTSSSSPRRARSPRTNEPATTERSTSSTRRQIR